MNRAPSDWYADEAFWVETYAYMFPEPRFEAAADEVLKLIELTGCESGAVLDLGCGPGRHAIPFAKRGFAVTGVDRTPWLLEKARARATAERADVEFVLEDMRRFERPARFDLAISMLTSFGYFDDPAENLAVLRSVHTSLKPGGAFVLDTMGKEIIARIFEATASEELEGGGILVQRRTVIDDWSRMENEWMLIKDGRARTFRLRHWIYSGRELRELLVAAGFSAVSLYGDLECKPYGPEAARMVAVARKEGE